LKAPGSKGTSVAGGPGTQGGVTVTPNRKSSGGSGAKAPAKAPAKGPAKSAGKPAATGGKTAVPKAGAAKTAGTADVPPVKSASPAKPARPSRGKSASERKGAARTPDDEFNDFKKMLSSEFDAKGDLTSGKLIELYRHGSRATVTKHVKQSLMKQAQALRAAANKGPQVLELGDFKLELKPGQSIEKQVDAFVKKLEGAHSMPQAFGKKLPGDTVRDLPGGKYNPDDALVQFTDKPMHTAMDQPWKDAFNNLRKSGQTETTAGKVFDMVADGIRKTPGMPDGEKASRIARLHDEMFTEMKLDPNRRYSVPRVYTWLEILGFKSKGK
jgi:hypothetical protein